MDTLHSTQTPICEDIVTEKLRGKMVTRKVCVHDFDDSLFAKKWKGIKSAIVVERTIQVKEEVKNETSLYISHLNKAVMDTIYTENKMETTKLSAKFQSCVREHWGIENRLHWVKDVILNEDENGIKNHNLAVNVAIFNTISINILRQNDFDSIKEGKTIFGYNLEFYINKIRT
jgi:predicted transposase YbfD/YdcC